MCVGGGGGENHGPFNKSVKFRSVCVMRQAANLNQPIFLGSKPFQIFRVRVTSPLQDLAVKGSRAVRCLELTAVSRGVVYQLGETTSVVTIGAVPNQNVAVQASQVDTISAIRKASWVVLGGISLAVGLRSWQANLVRQYLANIDSAVPLRTIGTLASRVDARETRRAYCCARLVYFGIVNTSLTGGVVSLIVQALAGSDSICRVQTGVVGGADTVAHITVIRGVDALAENKIVVLAREARAA